MPHQLILISIICSCIYYEITGLSPGGLIACSYLILYANQPYRIVSTLIISLIVFFIGKIVSKYWIIYGRRQWSIYIIISIMAYYIFGKIPLSFMPYGSLEGIGYIIPGLIGIDMERQGVLKTFISIGIVMGFLLLYIWLFIN